MNFKPANLIIPRLEINKFIEDEEYKNFIFNLVNLYVGGFCIFEGNIENTIETINFLNKYSQNVDKNYHLIFMADFEFGTAMRLEDGNSFPHNMALGNYNDLDFTYEISKQIALEIKALGIHWNLAPVVDINSNRNNPIINIRSYGENKDIVEKHSESFVRGHKEIGIITTIKHFPGHGDTSVDSHSDLPTLNKTITEFQNLELEPFVKHIKKNIDSIMIGHLHIQAIDNNAIPASISKNVISGLLKNDLKFGGIVITDALNMNPIKNYYTTFEAIEKAIIAGVDILLMPENPLDAINKINELYSNDENSKNSRTEHNTNYKTLINSSLLKFDKLKDDYSISEIKPNIEKYNSLIEKSQKLALKVAIKTLDLKINNPNIIPINETKKIAIFAFIQSDKDIEKASSFFNFLATNLENDLDFGFLDSEVSNEEIIRLKEDLGEKDIFIFCYFYKAMAYNNDIGNSTSLEIITNIMLNSNKNQKINIFFGNPYLSDGISGDVNIKTYSDSLPSLVAVALLLSGKEVEMSYLE